MAKVNGGPGDDLLYGTSQDDTINGKEGNDTLFGSENFMSFDGNDTFRASPGNDFSQGAGGNDVLQFNGSFADYLIAPYQDGFVFEDSVVNRDDAETALHMAGGFEFADGHKTATDFSALLGNSYTFSGGAVNLTGSVLNDYLAPSGSSNDTVDGGAGADWIDADGGDDMLTGGAGNDHIAGGQGMDMARYSGPKAQYSFSLGVNGAIVVTDSQMGRDGRDVVSGVEIFSFADGVLSIAEVLGSLGADTSALDTTGPQLIGLAPFAPSVGVPVRSGITLLFDEPVHLGAGNVNVYTAEGALLQSYSIENAFASPGNSELSLPFGSLAGYGQTYRFGYDAGAIVDASGNPVAALAGAAMVSASTDDYASSQDLEGGAHTDGIGDLALNGAASSGVLSPLDGFDFTSDNDWFSANLVAGTTYTFEMHGSTGGVRPGLGVAAGVLSTPNVHYADAGQDTVRFVYSPETSGTYFLVASALGAVSASGSYSLTAKAETDDQPWAPESGPTLNNDGAVLSGTIDFAGDIDNFKVPVQADHTYVVELISTGSLAGTLSMFTGTAFGNDGDSHDVNPGTEHFYFVAGGDYSLDLQVAGKGDSTGGYTLAVHGINTVLGTFKGNSLTGTSAFDLIAGYGGNDTLQGGAGDDHLDGGDGLDTAVYTGPRSGYFIVHSGLDTQIASDTGEGVDTLFSVERLHFSDVNVALDFQGSFGGVGSNALIVSRILGAVFGAPAVQNPVLVGIGLSLAGQAGDVYGLMDTALNYRLGAGYSDAQLVDLLYTNIIGSAPPPDTRDFFLDMLHSSQFQSSHVSFANFAASTVYNDASIDLVGLSQHGLAYV